MKNILSKKLINAKLRSSINQYNQCVEATEKVIKPFIDYSFGILYYETTCKGFVVHNDDMEEVELLEIVINDINQSSDMKKQLVSSKRELKKLETAKSKYDATIATIEAKLSPFVEFEFTVFYQQTDGFVVLDVERSRNMTIDNAIDTINEDGSLTVNNFFAI